jgi:hypothetical protein
VSPEVRTAKARRSTAGSQPAATNAVPAASTHSSMNTGAISSSRVPDARNTPRTHAVKKRAKSSAAVMKRRWARPAWPNVLTTAMPGANSTEPAASRARDAS